MKEKFDFIYKTVSDAIFALNSNIINVEHAKAIASLAKQANNVVATQLDAAKFMGSMNDAKEHLMEVGLMESQADESES